MTKRAGVYSTQSDPRFSKPLVEIDLSATVELIADLSAHAGKYNGWFIRGLDIAYGGTATQVTFGFSFASAASSIFTPTQDVGVFARFNTSTAATVLISGSGTGPINAAGAVGVFMSTTTGPSLTVDFTISGIRSGSPSFEWKSAYTATQGTAVSGNGGGVFFTTQPCSFIRVGDGQATSPGQRYSRGKLQVYGIP